MNRNEELLKNIELSYITIKKDTLFNLNVDMNKVVVDCKNMPLNKGSNELWAHTFTLDNWYLLLNPMETFNQEDSSPIVVKNNGKKNFLFFTSLKYLQEFCKQHQLFNNKDEVYAIKFYPHKDISWLNVIKNYADVYNIITLFLIMVILVILSKLKNFKN